MQILTSSVRNIARMEQQRIVIAIRGVQDCIRHVLCGEAGRGLRPVIVGSVILCRIMENVILTSLRDQDSIRQHQFIGVGNAGNNIRTRHAHVSAGHDVDLLVGPGQGQALEALLRAPAVLVAAVNVVVHRVGLQAGDQRIVPVVRREPAVAAERVMG